MIGRLLCKLGRHLWSEPRFEAFEGVGTLCYDGCRRRDCDEIRIR